MDTIPYLSVSQLKTHELNPLHWVLNKVLKIKSPGSKATEFGGRFHEDVERCLKGEADLDKIMPEVEDFLDRWFEEDYFSLGVLNPESVEHKFENFHIMEGLPPFTGVIDVLIHNPLRVIDHKTVGNKRYCLKQPDLKNDMQLILYAYYALTVIEPGAKEVVVQHNQFFKNLKRDKFAMIQDTLSREYVMEAIGVVQEAAASVQRTFRIYQELGISAVENRLKDCRHAFGGCPFLPVCDGSMEAVEFKRLQDSGLSCAQIADQKESIAVANMFAGNADTCYSKKKEKTALGKAKIEATSADASLWIGDCAGFKGTGGITMKEIGKVTVTKDLLPLINWASDATREASKNQFDHRKLVAQKVLAEVQENGFTTIVVPLFLVIGSDPDVTPTLTALRKAGINLIHVLS